MRWRGSAFWACAALALAIVCAGGRVRAQAAQSGDAASPAVSAPIAKGKPAAEIATPASKPAKAASPDSTPAQATIAAPVPPDKPAPRGFLVLLDPAHGGEEPGARLSDSALEKDINLAIAARLAAALSQRGMESKATRSGDATLSSEQRDATATNDGASICLILHATASGTGVHVYTALAPVTDLSGPLMTPWGGVQHSVVSQSRSLAMALGQSLRDAGLTVLSGEASLPALDGYNCPAVAIELAPIVGANGKPDSATDSAYQQRAADAIATAIVLWRAQPRHIRGIL